MVIRVVANQANEPCRFVGIDTVLGSHRIDTTVPRVATVRAPQNQYSTSLTLRIRDLRHGPRLKSHKITPRCVLLIGKTAETWGPGLGSLDAKRRRLAIDWIFDTRLSGGD